MRHEDPLYSLNFTLETPANAIGKEKNKSYKICEERVQGSMAMHTIVQNDKNDYDIDVAIVFEKDNCKLLCE